MRRLGLMVFFARIDGHQRRHGGEVLVAMEGYNGWARPLDTLVRAHGYRLFNIRDPRRNLWVDSDLFSVFVLLKGSI